MKKLPSLTMGILFLVLSNLQSQAQNDGDFRTKASGNFKDTTVWEIYVSGTTTWTSLGLAPNGTTNIAIQAAHTVTLDTNVVMSTSKNFTVNGTVICSTFFIQGTTGCTFTLAAGATLSTGNVNGILSGATATIRSFATNAFNNLANYIFAGTSSQTINLSNTSINNLTISTSGAATVNTSQTFTLTGTLTLTMGLFNMFGSMTLSGAPIAGTASNLNTNGGSALRFVTAQTGQFIPSSVTTLGSLYLDAGAGVPVTLNSNLTINSGNGLSLINGVLTCGSNTITIFLGATGGNAGSYVNGTLFIGANTTLYYLYGTFSYPVGTTVFAPLYITLTSGQYTYLGVTAFNSVPTGTDDGTSLTGGMSDKYWKLKVSGTNNIGNVSSIVTGPLGIVPALSATSALAFSANNVSLSYHSLGGIVSAPNIYSNTSLTGTQISDFTSADGSYIGISTRIPLAPGIYCIGPSASYTPPSGPAYVNGTSPYLNLSAATYDLNTRGTTGNIIFEFQNNYTSTSESNPILIAYQGTPTTTATFRVRSDLTVQLLIAKPRTNTDNFGVLDFNGADYVTFDGTINDAACGSTYGLIIKNTGGLGTTISFENDAQHNTLTGLQIEGYQNGIFFEYFGGAAGNDFTTIQCCKLMPVGTAQISAINTRSNTGYNSKNDNIFISNNKFENCYTGIVASGNGNNGLWSITGNHFYKTTAVSSMGGFIQISINDTGTVIVTGNYFGGSAPFAGGSKMLLSNGSSLISLNTLTTSANNSVFSNNVVQNISSNTNFELTQFNSPVDAQNNIIGNPNIANDISAGYGFRFLLYGFNYGGLKTINITGNSVNNITVPTYNTNTEFTLINYTSVGQHQVNITGNSFKNINTANHYFTGILTNIQQQFGYGSNVSYNTFENINQTVSSGALVNVMQLGGDLVNIVGNRIGHLSNANNITFENKVNYFITSVSALRVDSNIIANVNLNNTGQNFTNAISLSFPNDVSVRPVTFNTLKNISTKSTKNDVENANGSIALSGICFASSSANVDISNNYIAGLRASTTSSSANPGVAGIIFNTTGSITATNNTVYDLANTATNTTTYPFISGMICGGSGSRSIRNNMIAISNGSNTNGVRIFGIRHAGSSNWSLYHNTVAISGANTNAANSYAFYKENPGVTTSDIFKNNILYNARAGGTGKHFAVAHVSGVVNQWGTCDYNNLYSANPSTLGEWPLGTDKTFATWKTISTKDVNSTNKNVKFINLNTDLRLQQTTNCQLDGAGTSGTGVTADIDAQARNASTPDVGADEFTYNPNWATASSNSLVCSPPQNLLLNVTDNNNGAFTYNWSGPNGFTSTQAAPVYLDPPVTASGNYTVIVTDAFNCTSTPSTTIVGVHEPPAINCVANVTVNNATGLCSAIVNYAAAIVTGYPTPTVTYSQNSGTAFPMGTTTINVSATNDCGTATCSFTVTVTDNELPVISNCPSTVNLNTNETLCTNIAVWTAPTASDNCGILTFTGNHNSGETFPAGTTTVTYTATDIHGNVQTCGFNIIITDNEFPVIITYNGNINLNTTVSSCTAIANWTTPTVSDNCGLQSFIGNYNSGDAFLAGTTTVTYIATDIHGNLQTTSFNIIVTDSQLPAISNCPSTINLNNDAGNCSAVAIWTPPSASDNCSIQTFTGNHNSGESFPFGSTTVTYTATDIHGNSQTCSFNIIVSDDELPILSNCPSTINLNTDVGNCSAVATWIAPTASDNCGIQTFTSNHNSGEIFLVGTTTIIYTATDLHGNIRTCSFNVVVTDNVLPAISNCPSNIYLVCSGNGTWAAPTATDNCGIQSLTSNYPSGHAFEGTTAVIYTATDVHGNTQTCTFTVIVVAIQTNFSVSGGGAYCSAQFTGSNILLSGSQTGVNYQLILNGSTNVGSPLAGTGNPLTFFNLTTNGTYTVRASAGICSNLMIGSATIAVSPSPNVYAVSGGGSQCSYPGDPVTIMLSQSQDPFNYYLILNDSTIVYTIATDGSGFPPLTFYSTQSGIYTVIASDPVSGCTAAMNGNATVTIIPATTWYQDLDNDIYGNISVSLQACVQPLGYVNDSTDCNDDSLTGGTIHPNTIEICANGIDDNCNGQMDEGCISTINIKLFIEGLYAGNGLMQPVIYNTGVSANDTLCDSVIVELHDQFNPSIIIAADSIVIDIHGNGYAHFSAALNGGSYYLAIRTRNAIETWSKLPVTLVTNTSFDFSAP